PAPPEEATTFAADVWVLALFAYLRLAGLRRGFPGAGPRAFGFEFPPLRVYAPHLPPGVEPVLRRSLHADPARRHPTPAAFVKALADAFDAARHREEWIGAVSLHAEAATRAGL